MRKTRKVFQHFSNYNSSWHELKLLVKAFNNILGWWKIWAFAIQFHLDGFRFHFSQRSWIWEISPIFIFFYGINPYVWNWSTYSSVIFWYMSRNRMFHLLKVIYAWYSLSIHFQPFLHSWKNDVDIETDNKVYWKQLCYSTKRPRKNDNTLFLKYRKIFCLQSWILFNII